MAQYVTLKARRGQDTSFRIDEIQEIFDIIGATKSQIRLNSLVQPIEVQHTRKEILALIDTALAHGTEDSQ
jgi:hypothetical protein